MANPRCSEKTDDGRQCIAEAEHAGPHILPTGEQRLLVYSILRQAIDGAWAEAHEHIRLVKDADLRDALKRAVSLLGTREKAGQLVASWVEKARDQCIAEGTERGGLLIAASELADVLDVPIEEDVCTHPHLGTEGCSTCGYEMNSRSDDDE